MKRAVLNEPEKFGENPVCFALLIIINAGCCDLKSNANAFGMRQSCNQRVFKSSLSGLCEAVILYK
jgi:hypothetical protein